MRAYEDGVTFGINLASKRLKQDTDKTPSGYAAGVKNSLGDLFVIISPGEGESFLSEDESRAAYASYMMPEKHERHLVAYMIPIFRQRLMSSLSNDFVLVNSEEYAWIPQSAGLKIHYTAPDHFVSPHYLVQFRGPYENAPNNGEYGTFPVFSARKSLVAIGDAKKRLNDKGEGEFMKYLEAISYSCNDHTVARGFVYDWEKCSLMTAVKGSISQITTVKWTAPGSLAVICNYFRGYEREWHESLLLACNNLGVVVPRYSTVDNKYGQCVLGEGASARVFTVIRDQQPLAMKLVKGVDCCNELASEYETLQTLPDGAKGIVVGVEVNSLWIGSLIREKGDPLPVAAFLMSTVGIPFLHPSEVTDQYGPLIMETLSDLHAANISHGDARYNNVVRLENSQQFRWIDLRTCGRASSLQFQKDVITFFKSIDRKHNEVAVSYYATTTFNNTWTSIEARRNAARELWN
jgi:hypothetical protein